MIHRVSRILTSLNVDELRQKVDSSKLQAVASVFCSEDKTTPGLLKLLVLVDIVENGLPFELNAEDFRYLDSAIRMVSLAHRYLKCVGAVLGSGIGISQCQGLGQYLNMGSYSLAGFKYRGKTVLNYFRPS